MKRILTLLALVIVTGLATTSCTDENEMNDLRIEEVTSDPDIDGDGNDGGSGGNNPPPPPGN